MELKKGIYLWNIRTLRGSKKISRIHFLIRSQSNGARACVGIKKKWLLNYSTSEKGYSTLFAVCPGAGAVNFSIIMTVFYEMQGRVYLIVTFIFMIRNIIFILYDEVYFTLIDLFIRTKLRTKFLFFSSSFFFFDGSFALKPSTIWRQKNSTRTIPHYFQVENVA